MISLLFGDEAVGEAFSQNLEDGHDVKFKDTCTTIGYAFDRMEGEESTLSLLMSVVKRWTWRIIGIVQSGVFKHSVLVLSSFHVLILH